MSSADDGIREQRMFVHDVARNACGAMWINGRGGWKGWRKVVHGFKFKREKAGQILRIV